MHTLPSFFLPRTPAARDWSIGTPDHPPAPSTPNSCNCNSPAECRKNTLLCAFPFAILVFGWHLSDANGHDAVFFSGRGGGARGRATTTNLGMVSAWVFFHSTCFPSSSPPFILQGTYYILHPCGRSRPTLTSSEGGRGGGSCSSVCSDLA